MNPRPGRRGFGLLSILFVLACGSPGAYPLPRDPDVLLIDPQEFETTAVGAIPLDVELLTRYYHLELAAAERDRMLADRAQGEELTAETIRSALEASGMTAFAFRGTVGTEATGIKHHLDRGRPLLALFRPEDRPAYWTLLVGYDDASESIIVQNAQRGLAAMERQQAIEWWERAGNVLILAVPGKIE